MSEPSDWIVYILECADQTLYTGITNDLDHRIHAHENGRGAKYTRGRAPFKLIFLDRMKITSGGKGKLFVNRGLQALPAVFQAIQ